MAISILTSVIVHLVLSHFKHPAMERQNSYNSQVRLLSLCPCDVAVKVVCMLCMGEDFRAMSEFRI